jgi:hypothetical protein
MIDNGALDRVSLLIAVAERESLFRQRQPDRDRQGGTDVCDLSREPVRVPARAQGASVNGNEARAVCRMPRPASPVRF